MDKELFEILKSIQEDIREIKSSQERVESKLDHVFEQTVDLTEFKTEVITKLDSIQSDLNAVEVVTSKNWNDIARLKIIK